MFSYNLILLYVRKNRVDKWQLCQEIRTYKIISGRKTNLTIPKYTENHLPLHRHQNNDQINGGNKIINLYRLKVNNINN